MSTSDAHHISFCVHVKNRLHQLRETLPVNLDTALGHPGVGIVVFDYNSQDGLAEWMREHLRGPIDSGRVLYARERRARHFHMSKSKNLAHNVAPGRLLVNLDCDNFIGDTIPLLLDLARRRRMFLVHMWTGKFGDGTWGRIAVSRDAFARLGGYDESFLPVGFEDQDLIKRARLAGVDCLSVPGRALNVRALQHPRAEGLRWTGSPLGFHAMNQLNQVISRVNIWRRGFAANPGGWGRGRLEINFAYEREL